MTTEILTPSVPNTVESEVKPLPEILTTADIEWLQPLAGKGHQIDEAALATYNQFAEIGAKHLTGDIDPETFSSVMQARRLFYEGLLGWDDESHPLHQKYKKFTNAHERLVSLGTTVASLRAIHELGLNSQKVINAHPAAFSYAEANIRIKFGLLKRYGIDYGNVAERGIMQLFVLPTDTLTLTLAKCHSEISSVTELRQKAQALSRDPNNSALSNQAGREKLYRRNYPALVRSVGCMAVYQARRNGVDTWSYLPNEVIPAEALLHRPGPHADIVLANQALAARRRAKLAAQ